MKCKLDTVDNQVAILGGRNIEDEYFDADSCIFAYQFHILFPNF